MRMLSTDRADRSLNKGKRLGMIGGWALVILLLVSCSHFPAGGDAADVIEITRLNYIERGEGEMDEVRVRYRYQLSDAEKAYVLLGMDLEMPGYPVVYSTIEAKRGRHEGEMEIETTLPERSFFGVYLYLSTEERIDRAGEIARDVRAVRKHKKESMESGDRPREEAGDKKGEKESYEPLTEMEKEAEIEGIVAEFMKSGRFRDEAAARKAAEYIIYHREFIREVESK